MPRNKTARRTSSKKQTTKPQASSQLFATLQKMEKEFLKAPGKLVAQFKKELSTFKQKQKSLKDAISKTNTQLKTADNRVKTASKQKDTAMGKKRLTLAQKTRSQVVKVQNSLNDQLKKITKSIETAMEKQDKLQALRKYVSQFETEWNKTKNTSKKATATTATTTKKKTTAKKATPTKTKQPTDTTTQKPVDPYDDMIDENNIPKDETTEITS